MRKLRMDVDALAVESFSAGGIEDGAGTVEARMATPRCTHVLACGTVMRAMTCYSGCSEDCSAGCDAG